LLLTIGNYTPKSIERNNNNNNKVIDDNREKAFLHQRLLVLIQRYNAVAILGTFAHTTPEDEF